MSEDYETYVTAIQARYDATQILTEAQQNRLAAAEARIRELKSIPPDTPLNSHLLQDTADVS